jgi:putative DNA primase/helicase
VTAPHRSIQNEPPKPLPVSPEGIPPELKGRPQWVTWKYAWGGKKWTKHPYNPRTGRKASSTDLLTWSMFAAVLEAYESGLYDGIGFVLCSADPYAGVDLDGCRDPENGEIEHWAMEIIEALDSYTELSPSGEGVHIIVKGKVSAPLKRDRIEMYSVERYFTITGRVVGAERRAA